ncbi:MAG: hypothetical protein NC411_10575 [Bacteroides sp.]|nr:hypothetical protein [Bacteroides sp.]
MKKNVGQYHYAFRGDRYRIYRYVSLHDTGSCSTEVMTEPTFTDPEQARRRVYELNGWTYRPR